MANLTVVIESDILKRAHASTRNGEGKLAHYVSV
jgi:hypothetical protein